MRRDYVTLTVRLPDRDETDRPIVELAFDGPENLLEQRLQSSDGDTLSGEDVDVAYRLQTPVEDDDPTGVFSLTHRLTGEYLLEANVEADTILDLVNAAKAAADPDGRGGCYRIELQEDGRSWQFDSGTLLVYDQSGSLLRQHSLIPSGVEL
jgi:hypothetical protein